MVFMSEFFFGYEKIVLVIWVFLLLLLMIGLFFKFNCFWSVCNFDLMMFVLFVLGFLMI